MPLIAGSAGATSYRDVLADGNVPGGLIIKGAMQVGLGQSGIPLPFTSMLYGAFKFEDLPSTIEDGDSPIWVDQHWPPTLTGSGVEGVYLNRRGDISAADYVAPFVTIRDSTASAQPAFNVFKGGKFLLQVGGDGVMVNGKVKTDGSVTHSLGAYSGKSVPIYDESGTLLGYMPLYA